MLHELLGHRYSASVIINASPAETTYIDAGGLTFGVEYRELNADVFDENFGDTDDPETLAAIEIGRKYEEVGIAVHVFDTATMDELLRLDAFPGVPHYHYIVPGSHHTVVYWDETVLGPMVDRLPDFLGSRLSEMLLEVVDTDKFAAYDMDEVQAALPRVYDEIERSQRAHEVVSD